MDSIYFDYAASTPLDPRVFEAMKPYFSEKFGNPGSLHSFGQEAIGAVDKSRETIAKSIGADFREVLFTGSATEANNLALRGILKGGRWQVEGGRGDTVQTESEARHPQPATCNPQPRIIVSAIEHESVLETAKDLERDGVEVIYLPVDRNGIVDLEKLKSSLNERTVLVSIMYANNEIGAVQPIKEISKIIKDFRNRSINHELTNTMHHAPCTTYPLLHSDASQAFQFLNCNVQELGVDLMTLSAHKIYGPKGIGTLYVRNLQPATCNLQPLIAGGGQEFGIRSGTENVPAIVGFAEAVRLADQYRKSEAERIAKLSGYFWTGLKKIYPKAEINGFMVHVSWFMDKAGDKNTINHESDTMHNALCTTLPNILSVYFPDHLAEDLLTKFDLAGLAVSAGSACRSRAVESSYVIEALGYPNDRAKRSIRISFGRPTTEVEIKKALEIIKGTIL